MISAFGPDPAIQEAVAASADPLITWSWTVDISDVIVALGVVAALFIGIGNWVRESRREKKRLEEQRISVGVYLTAKLINISVESNSIRAAFESEFAGGQAQDGTRSTVTTKIFVDNPLALQLPKLMDTDSGMVIADILPSRIEALICTAEYSIDIWNRCLQDNSYRNVQEMKPADQDSVMKMLDMIDESISEARAGLDSMTEPGLRKEMACE